MASEVKRFEDLAIVTNDETKPLKVRTEAAAELARWTRGKSLGLVCCAQVPIAKDEKKPIEVRFEANRALLHLIYEKPPEFVCAVFRGLHNRIGDAVAVCAKCGKRVDDEAHGVTEYPGLYCGACCPACSLIPHEHLKEVPMTAELEDDMAARGFTHAEPFAREIICMVRHDHWNISPGVN